MLPHTTESSRPQVAVSACLLGEPVRHDGGHKSCELISKDLAPLLDLFAFCPERAIGLDAPRASLHLRLVQGQTRLMNSDGSRDHTLAMQDYAALQAALWTNLSGLILSKKSPSCGLERVRRYKADGHHLDHAGTGLFAQEIAKHLPLLPMEEEGRLHDVGLRHHFLERVHALHRWHQTDPARVDHLIEFHARHKLMLMARSTRHYQELGRLVAGVREANLAEQRELYIRQFMLAMALPSSRPKMVNVLQHAIGYFKRQLDSQDKQEFQALLIEYSRQLKPLDAPLELLRHYLRKFPQPYLAQQTVLYPYPNYPGRSSCP